jgi:hypothetical protein
MFQMLDTAREVAAEALQIAVDELTAKRDAIEAGATVTASWRHFTVTSKGETVTFTSSLSDAEAIAALAPIAARKPASFAACLVAAAKRYGRLSEKQLAWAHKLAVDAMPAATTTAAAPQAPAAPSLSAVVSMFDKAAAHLKYPKIRLQAADGTAIQLYRATTRSAHPGSVTIVGTGARRYFGRIDRDGTLSAGRDMTPAVRALVVSLAENPAGTAAAYGKLTCRCCYCGLHLEDARSTAVGYGPICADHYGMPWTPTEVAAHIARTV